MEIYRSGESVVVANLSATPVSYTESPGIADDFYNYARNGGIDATELSAAVGVVADVEIADGIQMNETLNLFNDRYVQAAVIFKAILGASLTAQTSQAIDFWRDSTDHLVDNSGGALDIILPDNNSIYAVADDAVLNAYTDMAIPTPSSLALVLDAYNDFNSNWYVAADDNFVLTTTLP